MTEAIAKCLDDLVKEAYERYGYTERGIRSLTKRIIADSSLREEVIGQAASDYLRHIQREIRQRLTASVQTEPRYSQEQQDAVERRVEKFLSWPMMDGTRLADADKEHVLADAERYKVNAEGNARNARFLFSVAARMEDGKKVKEVLSDRELIAIMREAGNHDSG